MSSSSEWRPSISNWTAASCKWRGPDRNATGLWVHVNVAFLVGLDSPPYHESDKLSHFYDIYANFVCESCKSCNLPLMIPLQVLFSVRTGKKSMLNLFILQITEQCSVIFGDLASQLVLSIRDIGFSKSWNWLVCNTSVVWRTYRFHPQCLEFQENPHSHLPIFSQQRSMPNTQHVFKFVSQFCFQCCICYQNVMRN